MVPKVKRFREWLLAAIKQAEAGEIFETYA